MSSHLGPIDIDCDALPYPVASACETLGFQAPLDVRWCRWGEFLYAHAESFKLLSSASWKQLFGARHAREQTCACGQALPILEQYTFTFQSGTQTEYRLGQCRRCNTMYWDEV